MRKYFITFSCINRNNKLQNFKWLNQPDQTIEGFEFMGTEYNSFSYIGRCGHDSIFDLVRKGEDILPP